MPFSRGSTQPRDQTHVSYVSCIGRRVLYHQHHLEGLTEDSVLVLVVQLCPTLWDPMDCSLPGSSVHGILQARILEWTGIPFFRGIFLTQGSNLGLLHCRQIIYCLNYQGSPYHVCPNKIHIPEKIQYTKIYKTQSSAQREIYGTKDISEKRKSLKSII